MEERQGMLTPALTGFLSHLLSTPQEAWHIVVDNARACKTAKGWQLKRQHCSEKAVSSRWSDQCNTSTDSPLTLPRRHSVLAESSGSSEPVYIKLVRRRGCHSPGVVDLLPVSVLRVARPAPAQVLDKVYNAENPTTSDHHNTDNDAAAESSEELDYDSESSAVLTDAPDILGLELGSSSSVSKADSALSNRLILQTIEKVLALSRPQQGPASRRANMEEIQETMEMLSSSRGADVVTPDVSSRTQRRAKRMANQGDRIHPEEKLRQKVEINDAMLEVIDRISVRAALTLTSALDCEFAEDESSCVYESGDDTSSCW
jgi:hypothetical protein